MQILKSFVVCVFILGFAYKLEPCNCCKYVYFFLMLFIFIELRTRVKIPMIQSRNASGSCLLSLSKYILMSHLVYTASNSQLPLTKWEVVIWNSAESPVLQTHCKSKDDDLG